MNSCAAPRQVLAPHQAPLRAQAIVKGNTEDAQIYRLSIALRGGDAEKIKLAFRGGDMEEARHCAEEAIRLENESLHVLQLSSRLDGIASNIKSVCARRGWRQDPSLLSLWALMKTESYSAEDTAAIAQALDEVERIYARKTLQDASALPP